MSCFLCVFSWFPLEMSIQLFLFPFFLFSGYLCLVGNCFASVISRAWNQSFPAHFNVIFEFLYRRIDVVLNSDKSSYSLFSSHKQSVYCISRIFGLMHSQVFTCSLVNLLKFLPCQLQELFQVLYKRKAKALISLRLFLLCRIGFQ